MPFLLLYWKWIVGAILVASLVGYYNVHVNRLVKEAVTVAVTERDASWREAETKAVNAAKAEARAKEASQAKDFAALQKRFEQEKANADKADAARIAAVRAGSRLRISSGCTGAANVPSSASPAAGSDAPPAAQFLGEADSAFLIGEARRADKIVEQLNLCQSTLQSERKSP